MTLEEIKAKYSMRDVAEMYGIRPNRAGFCHCPFHKGDRTASLKLYDHDFNCYGCGANGDIFTFVQLMNQCSFRDAFIKLGGTYGRMSKRSRMAIYRAEKKRQTGKNKERRKQADREEINGLITKYRQIMYSSEPMSDEWADANNKLQYYLYVHGEMNGMEY